MSLATGKGVGADDEALASPPQRFLHFCAGWGFLLTSETTGLCRQSIDTSFPLWGSFPTPHSLQTEGFERGPFLLFPSFSSLKRNLAYAVPSVLEVRVYLVR